MFDKRFARPVAMTAAATILSGCAMFADPGPPAAADRPISSVVPKTARFAASVEATKDCVVATEGEAAGLVALGTLAGGFVVDLAVTAAAEALQRAKDDLNGSFYAQGVDEDELGCLIVTNGLHGVKRDGVAAESGSMTSQHLETLRLADYPDFHLEMRAEWSADNKRLLLRPVFLRYAESSARRAGSGVKHVTVAVAFGPAPPSRASPSMKTPPSVLRHNFGELEIGSEYSVDGAAGVLDGAEAAGDVPAGVGASVAVLVTETADPSLALEVLAKAFGDGSTIADGLKGIVKEALEGS